MIIKINGLDYFLSIIFLLDSCSDQRHGRQDLIKDPFTQAQPEIKEVIDSIVKESKGIKKIYGWTKHVRIFIISIDIVTILLVLTHR